MSSTYSINDGTIIKTDKVNNITDILLELADNSEKMISPKNIRDSVYTLYTMIPFKQTTNSNNIEYIGVDSGEPNNKDIKKKILIGKKSFKGRDVMTNDLLQSDSDIFLYNTKNDDKPQTTKISILAGSDSTIFNTAPYIQSKYENNSTEFSIINPSPNGVLSFGASCVSINDVILPSYIPSNGQILKYSGTYPNGKLEWSNNDIHISQIGSSTSNVELNGTVSINGYPLEFIDNNPMPITIGGLTANTTFPKNSFINTKGGYQNYPLVEVIRKMLHPIVTPKVDMDFYIKGLSNDYVNTNYYVIGYDTNLKIDYQIIPYTSTIHVKISCDDNDLQNEQLNTNIGVPLSNSITITPSYFNTENIHSIKIETISDNITTKFEQPIYAIKPFYYGLYNTNNINTSNINSFTSSANIYRYESTIYFEDLTLPLYDNSNKYLIFMYSSMINDIDKIYTNNKKIYDKNIIGNQIIRKQTSPATINGYVVYTSTISMIINDDIIVKMTPKNDVLLNNNNIKNDITTVPQYIYCGIPNQSLTVSFSVNKITTNNTNVSIYYDNISVYDDIITPTYTNNTKHYTYKINTSTNYIRGITEKDLKVTLFNSSIYTFTKKIPLMFPVAVYGTNTDMGDVTNLSNDLIRQFIESRDSIMFQMYISEKMKTCAIEIDEKKYHYITILCNDLIIGNIYDANHTLFTAYTSAQYDNVYSKSNYISKFMVYKINKYNTNLLINYKYNPKN